MREIIDADVRLGRARLPVEGYPEDAEGLIELLSHYGIGRALVYHSLARDNDILLGNQLILEETKGFAPFIPAAIVVPNQTGEIGETDVYVGQLIEGGVRSLRLHPRQFSYPLTAWMLEPLVRFSSRYRLPILVDFDLEFWWTDNIDWHGLGEVLGAFPEQAFVLLRQSFEVVRVVYALLERFPNFHLGLGTYSHFDCIEDITRNFGYDRLIYASGLPHLEPGVILPTILAADVSEEAKDAILAGNLKRLIEEVKV